MKKFSGSVVVGLLLMSGLAVAGGDIAPVEPEVVVPASPPPAVDDSGLYLGVAYGAARYKGDYTGSEYFLGEGILHEWSGTEKIEYDTVMGQLGYKFNQYIALEGRYWQSFGDNGWAWSESGYYNGEPYSDSDSGANGDELKAWGVYVKPMYPITEQLDVYALLGYGNVTLSDDDSGDWLDENDFQWGIGASYEFMDNLSFFVDYVRLLDKGGSMTWDDQDSAGQESWDDTVYTVNVGLTYKF